MKNGRCQKCRASIFNDGSGWKHDLKKDNAHHKAIERCGSYGSSGGPCKLSIGHAGSHEPDKYRD